MDFASLVTPIYNLLLYVIPFLVLITILVFFHELGHYVAARRAGVKIESFAIGFGPEIFGRHDKRGTRWKVCWIPMGGYLQMFSDSDPASRPDAEKIEKMTPAEKAVSLYHKSVWQRIQIAAAGPIANYILAFLILTFLYTLHGKPQDNPAPRIGAILQDSPAMKAGLQQGDLVLSIAGEKVQTFEELALRVQAFAEDKMPLVVKRGDDTLSLHVPFSFPETPEDEVGVEKKQEAKRLLGVVPHLTVEKISLFQAMEASAVRCYDVTVMTLRAIGQMIIGKKGAQELSGPIGIARATKMAASQSVWDFMWFGAMISLALGIFNLLPIPALDGGHLMFYFIEAIRGRPLSVKVQERMMYIGFALLLLVFLFASANDINAMFLR